VKENSGYGSKSLLKANKLVPGIEVPVEKSINITETLSRDEKIRIIKQRCGVYKSHMKSKNTAKRLKRRTKR
jgi:hypothetical protein